MRLTENKKILITGASGFVGSRLCEMLYMHHDVEITALVRNMGRAARIGRLGVKIVRCDLGDKGAVNELVKESDVVIHLAAGNAETIINGTKNVAQAARKHNVARFVHMSSAAVYGIQPREEHCTEDAPLKKTGNPYGDAKIEAEKLLHKEMSAGLKCVILRPRIIYGPYSVYVTGAFSSLHKDKFVLVDEGKGACNIVYLDNLIDFILLSITNEKAVHETFFVTDDEKITWGEFYKKFLDMTGKDIEYVSVNSNKYENVVKKKSFLGDVKSFFTSSTMKACLKEAPVVKNISKPILTYLMSLPEPMKVSIKDKIGIYRPERHIKPVDELMENFDSSRLLRESGISYTSMERAKRLLGYSPNINFTRGAELTELWLKYTNYI